MELGNSSNILLCLTSQLHKYTVLLIYADEL